MHLVHKIGDKRFQSSTLLASPKFFEGVRNFDVVLDVPLPMSIHGCIKRMRCDVLAQFVDEDPEAIAAVYLGYSRVVCGPVWC